MGGQIFVAEEPELGVDSLGITQWQNQNGGLFLLSWESMRELAKMEEGAQPSVSVGVLGFPSV